MEISGDPVGLMEIRRLSGDFGRDFVRSMEISGDQWRSFGDMVGSVGISRDVLRYIEILWRCSEILWRLLEIVGDCWRFCEIL